MIVFSTKYACIIQLKLTIVVSLMEGLQCILRWPLYEYKCIRVPKIKLSGASAKCWTGEVT